MEFRLYRVILTNPSHPGQEGKWFAIQDWTACHRMRLPWVLLEAEGCRRFYRRHGVLCRHVVAVYRAWTCEYLEVREQD